jgi:hypothetical protein
MFRFQLEIAGLLAATAGASAIAFWVSKTTADGKIQLPTHEDEDQARDPFDVTSPTDFVDGYPIEEPKFWANVRELSFIRFPN